MRSLTSTNTPAHNADAEAARSAPITGDLCAHPRALACSWVRSIVLTCGLASRVSLKESSCSTRKEREPAPVEADTPRLAKIQIVVLHPH
jgi:hypothetical protein